MKGGDSFENQEDHRGCASDGRGGAPLRVPPFLASSRWLSVSLRVLSPISWPPLTG